MDLKEVLHLYLGCEMQKKLAGRNEGIGILDVIDGSIYTLIEYGMLVPILRPLSDMTKEEQDEYNKIMDCEIHDFQCLLDSFIKQSADGTRFLLSHHFDLFGLIESGQAIDKTTINNKK